MTLEKYSNGDFKHKNSSEEAQEFVTGVLETQVEAQDQHMGPSNDGLMLKPILQKVRTFAVAALKLQKVYKSFRTRRRLAEGAVVVGEEDNYNGDGGGDDDNNGGGGDDDHDNGGSGGNNKRESKDRDGDGNGDKDKRSHDDGGGYTKGKNMDFMGEAGFGYRYGYHAGNENEYPIGQLSCAREVQSSESKCLFYHAIM